MITYCILCREPIPEKRQRRGAATCKVECQRELRRQRRSERALMFCRLCGRRGRQPKVVGPVLHEHAPESAPIATENRSTGESH
jgi:hypothetical protein